MSKRSGTSKPKGAVRAKSGCYTCRIRRKKCDENPDADGSCQTCVRLHIQCLGFGAKRPEWMRVRGKQRRRAARQDQGLPRPERHD
ncbi:hypothetical protein DFH11DRAFT_1570582 [Phellopilus nigrolimitatus]|nr:hypothetical protein DFH11DRAFT_1570582 [Phellopilus nigrolimitatus]